MRGKALMDKDFLRYARITPAYAGKSCHELVRFFQQQDHPCICGEKWKHRTYLLRRIGSPLHMRGKDAKNVMIISRVRITPAYAGKRRQRTFVTLRYQDHPCICGEKHMRLAVPQGHLGSPLHMRGKVSFL